MSPDDNSESESDSDDRFKGECSRCLLTALRCYVSQPFPTYILTALVQWLAMAFDLIIYLGSDEDHKNLDFPYYAH